MSLFVSGFSQQLGEVRFAYDANGNRICEGVTATTESPSAAPQVKSASQ